MSTIASYVAVVRARKRGRMLLFDDSTAAGIDLLFKAAAGVAPRRDSAFAVRVISVRGNIGGFLRYFRD